MNEKIPDINDTTPANAKEYTPHLGERPLTSGGSKKTNTKIRANMKKNTNVSKLRFKLTFTLKNPQKYIYE